MLIVHILQRIITFIVRQTNKIIKFRWKTGSFTKTCIICIMSTLNLSRTSNFHILNMKFIFTFVPTKEKRQTFDISILVNIAYWYIYIHAPMDRMIVNWGQRWRWFSSETEFISDDEETLRCYVGCYLSLLKKSHQNLKFV